MRAGARFRNSHKKRLCPRHTLARNWNLHNPGSRNVRFWTGVVGDQGELGHTTGLAEVASGVPCICVIDETGADRGLLPLSHIEVIE